MSVQTEIILLFDNILNYGNRNVSKLWAQDNKMNVRKK